MLLITSCVNMSNQLGSLSLIHQCLLFNFRKMNGKTLRKKRKTIQDWKYKTWLWVNKTMMKLRMNLMATRKEAWKRTKRGRWYLVAGLQQVPGRLCPNPKLEIILLMVSKKYLFYLLLCWTMLSVPYSFRQVLLCVTI